MARPRTTVTPPTPTRAPRKPAKASQVVKGGNDRQKGTTGRGRPSKDGAKGTANRFDDIARAVAAGDDDLARKLAQSIDQAKDKGGRTAKGMPSMPDDAIGRKVLRDKAKPDAKATGPTFRGRPTSKVETIAQRAKESGLWVRASMDVADIAQRLRATPDAVAAWLAARDGSKPTAPAKPAKPAAPAKPTKPTAPATAAKPKAPAKAEAPPKAPSVRLRHGWQGPIPKELPELKGASLIMRYEVRDGIIWSRLEAVHGPDGTPLANFLWLPLDYRWHPEVADNGRKVHLRDQSVSALEAWLDRQGLVGS